MVLLSFLLVLAAAVTLVIGLLNSGLGLIYVSIACSLGAGVGFRCYGAMEGTLSEALSFR